MKYIFKIEKEPKSIKSFFPTQLMESSCIPCCKYSYKDLLKYKYKCTRFISKCFSLKLNQVNELIKKLNLFCDPSHFICFER